jgi:amino acid transporter/nucleotide-binding universal stress UspA family protein
MDSSLDVNRPRNLDWKRAAALLYGDWGTSKAYVIGFAFLALQFASLHTILAVCAITGLVGINYAIVCRYFPDGGGVYSAARSQGRALAVVGALLLVADLTVTAALSGYEAIKYLAPGTPSALVPWVTIVAVAAFGVLNAYGPRHSGALAVCLAIPMVLMVLVLIALSAPYLTTHLHPLPADHTWMKGWEYFVGAILALSGVEAIASLTGVMKPDADSKPGKPKVGRESAKAIIPVAVEVVVCTALLGWATASLWQFSHSAFEPGRLMEERLMADTSHLLRALGEEYGAIVFGHWTGVCLGIAVGIIVGLLLLSAVNTAVAALIGMLYTLARDGEMPRSFLVLNRHGVPKLPLVVAVILPCIVLAITSLKPESALETLGHLYAIGVVGAIAVNLGSCTFNRALPLKRWERSLFAFTFAILFCVEITLAYDKHIALFFVVIILSVGFWLRSMAHKASGLATVTIAREMAETVTPEAIARLRPAELVEGGKILVSARGLTPVLRYALKEAKLHRAVLCVLYVKEIAILIGGPRSELGRKPRWQDDAQASAIMSLMLRLGEEMDVCVQPIYAVSTDPATTIVDVAATLGADSVMLGSAHRSNLARLLKGNVVEQVARALPEDIELVIHG